MIKSKLVNYYLQKWSPLLKKSTSSTSSLDYFYFINQNKFINYLLELNYYSPVDFLLLTRLINLILTNKSVLTLLSTSKIISERQRKSRKRRIGFIKKLLKRSIKTKNWTFEKYVREADCFIDEDEFFEFRLIPENRVYLLPFKKRKRYLSLLTRYNFLRVSKIKLMNKFFRKLVTNTSKSGKQKSSFSRWVRALSRRRSKFSVNIYNYLQVLLKKTNPRFFFKRHSLGRRTAFITMPVQKKKEYLRAAKFLKNAIYRRREHGLLSKMHNELFDIFIKRGEIAKAHKKTLKSVFDNRSNSRFLKWRKDV